MIAPHPNPLPGGEGTFDTDPRLFAAPSDYSGIAVLRLPPRVTPGSLSVNSIRAVSVSGKYFILIVYSLLYVLSKDAL